jgi:hypothetical protein
MKQAVLNRFRYAGYGAIIVYRWPMNASRNKFHHKPNSCTDKTIYTQARKGQCRTCWRKETSLPEPAMRNTAPCDFTRCPKIKGKSRRAHDWRLAILRYRWDIFNGTSHRCLISARLSAKALMTLGIQPTSLTYGLWLHRVWEKVLDIKKSSAVSGE